MGAAGPRLWLALAPALAGYGLAAWLVLRRGGAGLSGTAVAAAAVLFRLILLGAPPSLSDDVYRYLWEGRVQAAGLNPYTHPPAAPALAHLRDAGWERINHREVVTVYPPAAQLLFRAVAGLWPTVTGLKAALVACDLVLLRVLAGLLARRGAARGRLLLYAWHPLPVVEIAGNGHVDVLAVTLLMAGLLWLADGRRHLAAWALAGAVLGKLVPVLCAPAFWRYWARAGDSPWRRYLDPRPRWPLLWVPVLVTAAFLPFAGAGSQAWSGLRTYAEKWQFNGSAYPVLYRLLRDPGPGWDDEALMLARWVCLAGLLAASAWAAWRWEDPLRVAFAALGAHLLLSPTVHPWYALWVLPFLPFFPAPGWMAFTWLVLLAYQVLPGYRSAGVWQEAGWVRWAEYGPLYLLLLLSAWRGRRRGHGSPTPTAIA